MIEDVLHDTEERMRKCVEVLRHDLAMIRTGRASPALVERLPIDYYGTLTPLNQLAGISIPEARLIVIKPWDSSTLSTIERAILKSDLGLTPHNDGKLIRLAIPPLTEERRRELVKQAARRVEEARVAVRNCRRDGIKDLEDFEEEKLITEDDLFRGKEKIQELTDRMIEEVNEVGKAKEAEIMEV
jgi:ribosome recycling factor